MSVPARNARARALVNKLFVPAQVIVFAVLFGWMYWLVDSERVSYPFLAIVVPLVGVGLLEILRELLLARIDDEDAAQ